MTDGIALCLTVACILAVLALGFWYLVVKGKV